VSRNVAQSGSASPCNYMQRATRYHWDRPRLTTSTRQAPSGVCIAYPLVVPTWATVRSAHEGAPALTRTTEL